MESSVEPSIILECSTLPFGVLVQQKVRLIVFNGVFSGVFSGAFNEAFNGTFNEAFNGAFNHTGVFNTPLTMSLGVHYP